MTLLYTMNSIKALNMTLSDFHYNDNSNSPFLVSFDNFFDKKLPSNHSHCSTSSNPIPVIINKNVQEVEANVAEEDYIMEIKELQMLSLITGTPTKDLSSNIIDSNHHRNEDYDDSNNSKVSSSYPLSPYRNKINQFNNININHLNSNSDKWEYKIENSQDDCIFELEL